MGNYDSLLEQSTIITHSSRPAYVVNPVIEKNYVVDIHLNPIVGWRVEFDPSEETGGSIAFPVTTDCGLPKVYAIYYQDTDEWSIPNKRAGNGLISLLKYFQRHIGKIQAE